MFSDFQEEEKLVLLDDLPKENLYFALQIWPGSTGVTITIIVAKINAIHDIIARYPSTNKEYIFKNII